jgi:hypothetical protein
LGPGLGLGIELRIRARTITRQDAEQRDNYKAKTLQQKFRQGETRQPEDETDKPITRQAKEKGQEKGQGKGQEKGQGKGQEKGQEKGQGQGQEKGQGQGQGQGQAKANTKREKDMTMIGPSQENDLIAIEICLQGSSTCMRKRRLRLVLSCPFCSL